MRFKLYAGFLDKKCLSDPPWQQKNESGLDLKEHH